jgi:uncharacterized protein (DUF488 family)
LNPKRPLITVGHGTLAADDLIRLLEGSGVSSVVDVRTAPGSRRSPHMRRQEMETWLPAAGIDYRWEPRLGGFRKPRVGSPNRALRNDSFRGYADYMQTDQFWEALDPVVLELRDRSAAVMCSEAVWWRCHRRLVADAVLLGRNVEVEHLMHDGRRVPHTVTEGARLTEDDRVVYDAGEAGLFV